MPNRKQASAVIAVALAAFASAHASEVPEPGLIIWGIAAGLLAYSRRRR